MRAYLRCEDGMLELRTLDRMIDGTLTDGHGIINLADQHGIINLADQHVRMTLRGWPDGGPAGVYMSDLGQEYVIPYPICDGYRD